MKIDFLINDEDRREVEGWVKELEEGKLKIGDSISSGGLGVIFTDKYEDGTKSFDVYRLIGIISRKPKKLLKKRKK